MLVLVAGITGNLGQKLLTSLISRGHSVRGLGRNPDKLSADDQAILEGFVRSETYHDVPSLQKACQGVDAVICCYSGQPELQLEAQLFLLRAVEQAGVRRYIASSWNYDWRRMELGQQESYDPFICFRRMAELVSTVKPIYILTGVLAEVLFSLPGHGDFSPKNNGIWDPEKKEMQIYGTGKELWQWTSEKDAAEFTAAIVEHKDAEKGGFWSVYSGEHTLREIARTYKEVRRCEVSVVEKGTLEDLRREAFKARENGQPNNFWGYIGWFYQLWTVDGSWIMREDDRSKLSVTPSTLKQFLEENPGL